MMGKLRDLISVLFGLAALAIIYLVQQTNPSPVPGVLEWLLFTSLLAYTSTYGIPIGVGEVSLVPMVAMAATISLGIFPAAVAVIVSDIFYGIYRWMWPEKSGWEPKENSYSLLATTTANITMHALSVVAAGMVFGQLGGNIPVGSIKDILALVVMGAAYLITNYILAALFLLFRSRAHVRHLINNLPNMLVYEALSLFFAPLASSILKVMGLAPFIVFSLSLVISSVILKLQAVDKASLEERVRELRSLQTVSQSLSAHLDQDEIADAIYAEVSNLMPTDNFYMALLDPESNVIRFPVTYEHNQKRPSKAREQSGGLTEYVIETGQPLLIKKNVRETAESMGITHFGQEALSWMGVPLKAGDEVLGMIAVQAYPLANEIPVRLNETNLEVLMMIAAQGAIALKNATLYTQTDQALGQRVRVLNSILNTTSEGIALLSPTQTLLEINRALCNMLDTFPAELVGQAVENSKNSTLAQLQIEPSIREKTLTLSESRVVYEDEVTLIGKKAIPAKRTISAVRDDKGVVSGWLLVFRDLTEEHQLAEFREDLTNMLVHDLRSPVVSIQGGLDMVEVLMDDGKKPDILEMVNISRKGTTQILGMINELLDLNRLESGGISLALEPIDIAAVFREESIVLHSVIQQADITLKENFSREFPIVQGDSGLLRRVFHNLLDNAVKFAPDEGTVEIWGKPDPDNPGKVLMGVKDNGPGIPEDKVGQLFEKYYTGDQAGSRRKGTGLGLHFCKLAVEAHQGEIWAESKPGEGCNIIIRVPAQ